VSSKTWSALKWAGKKVSEKAKARAAKAKCVGEPRRPGVRCGRPVATGRRADGVTCGRVECGLSVIARDPEQTAEYLGITTKELEEQIAAVKQR
jgi:hypothetical protein